MGAGYTDVAVLAGSPYLFTEAAFRGRDNWYIRGVGNGSRWACAAPAVTPGAPEATAQVVNESGVIWDSGEVATGMSPCCIALLPNGYQVTWITTIPPIGSIAHRINLDWNMVPLTARWAVATTEPHGSAQGMLDSFADQAPLLTQTVSPRIFAGHTLGLWTQRGPWVIGQSYVFFGIMGVNVNTGVAYVVTTGNSQTPSHLALMDDGSPIAVGAQSSALIPFSAWTVWTPTPPDPPDPPDPPIPPHPPDPPIPPIPPIPPKPPVVRPFPWELYMAEGGFTVTAPNPDNPFALKLNEKGDLDPNDPGAGVFLGPNCFHMKHPAGGYVGFDVSNGADGQPKWVPVSVPYVGSVSNFQWDGKANTAIINCGVPLLVRSFLVGAPK